MNADFDPDIIDLQSWIRVTQPAVWAATKYASTPYDYWRSVWRAAGKPQTYEAFGETWSISMEASR